MQRKGKKKEMLSTARRLPPVLPIVDKRFPATFREISGMFCGNSEFSFTYLFHYISLKKLGFP